MSMKKKFTLLETIIHYKQVLYVFTAIAMLVGVVALIQMPRDEFPEFKIRSFIKSK